MSQKGTFFPFLPGIRKGENRSRADIADYKCAFEIESHRSSTGNSESRRITGHGSLVIHFSCMSKLRVGALA